MTCKAHSLSGKHTPHHDEKKQDRKRESRTSNSGSSPLILYKEVLYGEKGKMGNTWSGEEIFPTNMPLCVLPGLCIPTEMLWAVQEAAVG